MRIMALDAIRSCERLSVVCFYQIGGAGVVAVETKCRCRLGEVIIELGLTLLARLVGRVTSIATRIERGMLAAFFRNIKALGVTFKTEILALIARCRFEQLILVVRCVRTVTFQAIANGGRMDCSLYRSRVHVGMTGNTERLRRSRRQLNASDIFADADFMTTGAARGDRGVNELAFSFVFVTLDASRCFCIWV